MNYGTSSRVRAYQFNYMHEGANAPPQRTVHLKEIVLCGETNNEKLNATTITWGPQNYVTPNTESFIFNDSLPKGYFLPMNRSHDGYTDLVVYAQNADQNSWKCYEWRIDLNKYLPKTKGNHKKDAIVFKADLGGDGSDELCFLEKFNGDFPIYWFKRTTNFSKEIGWNYKQFFLGDFTGTGATDIIFMKDSIFRSFIVFIDEVFSFNPELPINKKCKVRVGDFYGSGTSQLEVVLADGSIFIYYSNANGNFSNSQKGGYANSFPDFVAQNFNKS